MSSTHRMTSNVSLQLAQLNARIVTLRTFMRLFMCVSISNMTHKLARCGEGRVAELASVRLVAGVSVVMIGETGDGFEATFADRALVGSDRRKVHTC